MFNNIVGSIKLNMNSNAFKSVAFASSSYVIGKGIEKYFDKVINDKKCDTKLKKYEMKIDSKKTDEKK
jgi:hypothetical protein